MGHIGGVKTHRRGRAERSRCGLAHGPIESHCGLPAIKGAQLGVSKPERGEVVCSPEVKVTYSRKGADASQYDVYRARAAEDRSEQTCSFARVVKAP